MVETLTLFVEEISVRTLLKTPVYAIVATAVLVAGCSKQNPATQVQQSETRPNQNIREASLTPKERAINAKDELFKRLSSELMRAMSSGGPAAAIEVCSQKAPKIAAAVGKEHNVLIGRTSFKLRNPVNAPPTWATEFISQRVAEPQFVDLEHGLGAFLPIQLKSQCLACHGQKEHMSADVIDRLAALYPRDSATGFQEGDLRGWFWVEVPNDASEIVQ